MLVMRIYPLALFVSHYQTVTLPGVPLRRLFCSFSVRAEYPYVTRTTSEDSAANDATRDHETSRVCHPGDFDLDCHAGLRFQRFGRATKARAGTKGAEAEEA